MSDDVDKVIEIRDSTGRLCGTYHYEDPFKSFFRGLYTPSGVNVVASPPPEHPHHKGLQFGLTCRDVNFWEESLAAEPGDCQLPIGVQQTTQLLRLDPTQGNGFLQEIQWRQGQTITFQETRIVSVKEVFVSGALKAYAWNWRTRLTAKRNVTIISSVWGENGNCGRSLGYCGLGLRLIRDVFQRAHVEPHDAKSGDKLTSVSYIGQYLGKPVTVTFGQDPLQRSVFFLSFYGGNPDFAFMALGPTNSPPPLPLGAGETREWKYDVTVADS